MIKKLKQKINRKLHAGMTTYVMIMFGLIIVMYLMGFTSPFIAYQKSQDLPPLKDDQGNIIYERDINGTFILDGSGNKIPRKANITSPAGGIGTNVLDWIMQGVQSLFQSASENPFLAIIASIVTVIGFWILSKVGGQFALTYIIPIMILAIFMNIFVFPTSTLQGMVLAPFDIIIFGFLNLFLVLSIIEFVRGSI